MGKEIALKLLDVRFNGRQRRVDFRDYLEKVVILQWTKKYSSKGHCFVPHEDVVELKTEDQTIKVKKVESKEATLKTKNGEVKLDINPLHIRKPTADQVEFINQLFC